MNIQSNLHRVASQTLTELPNPGMTTLPNLWLNLPGGGAEADCAELRATSLADAIDGRADSGGSAC